MAVAAHTHLCYHVKWNLNQITAEMHEMSVKGTQISLLEWQTSKNDCKDC